MPAAGTKSQFAIIHEDGFVLNKNPNKIPTTYSKQKTRTKKDNYLSHQNSPVRDPSR